MKNNFFNFYCLKFLTLLQFNCEFFISINFKAIKNSKKIYTIKRQNLKYLQKIVSIARWKSSSASFLKIFASPCIIAFIVGCFYIFVRYSHQLKFTSCLGVSSCFSIHAVENTLWNVIMASHHFWFPFPPSSCMATFEITV